MSKVHPVKKIQIFCTSNLYRNYVKQRSQFSLFLFYMILTYVKDMSNCGQGYCIMGKFPEMVYFPFRKYCRTAYRVNVLISRSLHLIHMRDMMVHSTVCCRHIRHCRVESTCGRCIKHDKDLKKKKKKKKTFLQPKTEKIHKPQVFFWGSINSKRISQLNTSAYNFYTLRIIQSVGV